MPEKIQCIDESRVLRRLHHPDPRIAASVRLHDRKRLVGGSVIDQHQFKIRERLRQATLDCQRQGCRRVARGNHDRQGWQTVRSLLSAFEENSHDSLIIQSTGIGTDIPVLCRIECDHHRSTANFAVIIGFRRVSPMLEARQPRTPRSNLDRSPETLLSSQVRSGNEISRSVDINDTTTVLTMGHLFLGARRHLR